jgi:hypothetical protein
MAHDALFRMDGDRFIPHELTRGPWAPDAMHGGPIAALLARAGERVEAPGPMHPARMTLELMRPVRLVPLAVDARVIRPGKKVQWVEVRLLAEGTELARATLLRLRTAAIPWPARTAGGDTTRPFGGPDAAKPAPAPWSRDYPPAYHGTATEHRVIRGDWGALGPSTDWIRLRLPIVAGETPSPFQRVAAVADFGNGISSALPFESHRFINADLTITLHRLPATDWVCLDATTYPEPHGVGVAESVLYDERGRIGHAAQALLLEPW